MERPFRPTPEDVARKSVAVARLRSRSPIHKLEHVIERFDEFTGATDGNEDPKKLTRSVAIMVGATAAAVMIPDPTVSTVASDLVSGFGGAFIGETIAPVSRRLNFNRKEYLEGLAEVSDQDFEESLPAFFATYKDVLTEDEIKHRLLGRIPAPDEKPVSDQRYSIVDEVARRTKAEHKRYNKEKSGPYERLTSQELRERVMDTLMLAQYLGLEQRGSAHEIRKEFLTKASDIVSGLMVVVLASEVINHYLHGPLGSAIGLADDLALLFTVLGSVALKNLGEKANNR